MYLCNMRLESTKSKKEELLDTIEVAKNDSKGMELVLGTLESIDTCRRRKNLCVFQNELSRKENRYYFSNAKHSGYVFYIDEEKGLLTVRAMLDGEYISSGKVIAPRREQGQNEQAADST